MFKGGTILPRLIEGARPPVALRGKPKGRAPVIPLETLRETPVDEIWAYSTGRRNASTMRSCDGRPQAAAWPNHPSVDAEDQ